MRARRGIALGLSALLVSVALQALTVTASSATGTHTETVGGNANTWTNYTNAGGYQGPTIPAFSSVEITCTVQGFRVADGNTSWYQIASSPWNNLYYVSADAFYNNGQTSGSLQGTPFVDPAVPDCASIAGGTSETTGGAANTWTDYNSAGGSQGPTIAGFTTVQIECALTGFRVADGNTWWYRIASSPWNHAYYVSADAFYNNGATSGSLRGTPFVDPAVPQCGSGGGGGGGGSGGTGETAGGAAQTWTNYTNAGGTQGQTIASQQSVQITCKLTGFRVANGNTWWYQIASSPWNNNFYVSADAFYNNGATSGSLLGTPYVDAAVPDCATPEQPRPSGETTGGATSTFGNYSHAGVPGPTIPAFTTVQVVCRVTGFRVPNGNTWWYLIASAPWNSVYYASADPFYNNGQTSGSLSGTPFVDTAVPLCVNNREAPIYSTAYGSSSSGSHASSNSTSCLCGDPVNTASGDFYEPVTDFSIPGRGPGLKLVRTYNDLTASTVGIFGNGWASTYDQHLLLNGEDGSIQISLEDGSQLIAQPDGSGGFTLPASADSTLARNGDGTFTLRQRESRFLDFSATGQLVALRDLNGYRTTLSYASGRLSSVTDSSGRTLQFTFGSNSLVSSVRDPLGRTTTYAYDTNGNLTSATDALARTSAYGYDSSNRMTTVTDPRSGTLTNVYDTQGRVTSQTDAAGLITTFAYTGDNFSSLGGTTTLTDPRGTQEVLVYANGFLTKDIKASGTTVEATWTYVYDQSNFGVTSSTDPNGRVTTHTYDAAGHRLTTTDPLGRVTADTYNTFGEVLTSTSPLNETLTNAYDAAGNLLSKTGPLGDVTTYAYADSSHPGDVTTATDPDGRVTNLTYDSAGDVAAKAVVRSTTTTDTTQLVYDADGEQICRASANAVALGVLCPPAGGARVANTTTTAYDAVGQVVSVTDPNDHTTSYSYDGNGNRTQITDASARTTTMVYDPDNRKTKTTKANGSVEMTAYDGRGNAASITDPNGRVTTNSYDALNRLASTTNPLNQTTSYDYDRAGNKTKLTDASGRATSYGYDNANELTSVGYSDGTTPGVTYAYDADGRRTSMVDGTGTSTYAYDALGRLTSTANGAGAAVGYSYDRSGHATSITYPNGKKVIRTYDGAGNLVTVKDWLNRTSAFGYDGNQNLTSQLAGSAPAVVDSFSYDASDHLTNITDAVGTTTLQSFAYTRTATDLVSTVTPNGSTVKNYSYDQADQLTQDSQGSYTYDAAGNATKLITAAGLSYNAGDELTKRGKGSGATNFTYTAQGERTVMDPPAGATSNYSYDQAGRLTGFSKGTTTAAYGYDGDGMRSSKQVGSTSTPFTWDTTATNPLLLTEGTTNYIYGPGDLPIESLSNTGAINFFHHDQLGSTTMLTSSTGTVISTLTYGSYGTLRTGTATRSLLFAGQYRDKESGLYYLRARYYDPASGQFMTVDPALTTTQAPYRYANSDPVNVTDPSGQFGWSSVTNHWRGIAQFGVGVAGGLAAGACIAATFGICAGAIGTILATGAIGGGVGVINYALSGGIHTAGGYFFNGSVGAVFGAAGGACAALLSWCAGAARFGIGLGSEIVSRLLTDPAGNASAPGRAGGGGGGGGGWYC